MRELSQRWSIMAAGAQDVSAIAGLLLLARLPTNDIERHLADFVVARSGDRVIGAAGMERYPPHALLRSVVVEARWRRHGIARALTQTLLDRARASGIANMYLLTESAADCFGRLGFEPCARERFPAELATAPQVATLCCASAQGMRRAL
ncbi:MAG TPA: arsenic resistance N-acetyltransferase ArsN2 [Casimicrobiaceae bacterium]|nr:arsenic resistance N-acetyltransferase ArsN2 [Casimicrobiaceae bacterium]